MYLSYFYTIHFTIYHYHAIVTCVTTVAVIQQKLHSFPNVIFTHASGKLACETIKRDLLDQMTKRSVLCSFCENIVLPAFQNKFLTL